jgi:hypothetical protein
LQEQLKQEHEQKETVSKAVYQREVDKLNFEKGMSKKYQDWFRREEAKRIELESEVVPLRQKIKELEKNMSRPNAGKKRQSNFTDEDLVELRKQGFTIAAIKEKSGMSTSNINRILKKNNVKRVYQIENETNDTN